MVTHIFLQICESLCTEVVPIPEQIEKFRSFASGYAVALGTFLWDYYGVMGFGKVINASTL